MDPNCTVHFDAPSLRGHAFDAQKKIIKRAFRITPDDTQGFASHSLGKSWAMRPYETIG